MQFILSPAKTIDLNATCPDGMESLPDFSNQALFLMSILKNIDQSRLKELMKLSEKLSKTVWDWHQNWECSEAVDKALRAGARPCAFAMQGEAFKYLGLSTLKRSDIEFAQSHLLIISGLYGLLRPCDIIMPYRLEMGLSFKVDQNNASLYSFWAKHMHDSLSNKLKELKTDIILNLASEEYSKVIKRTGINARIITCTFLEESTKGYKSISTYAKQARGAIARFAIQEKLAGKEGLKKLMSFNNLDYSFNSELSTPNNMIFTRFINK
jgi:cytoplasmic iron level regulating protein YaaA (DUF328/UPF0246 family)